MTNSLENHDGNYGKYILIHGGCYSDRHVRDFGGVNGNAGHRAVFLTRIVFEGDKHTNPLVDLATGDEI